MNQPPQQFQVDPFVQEMFKLSEYCKQIGEVYSLQEVEIKIKAEGDVDYTFLEKPTPQKKAEVQREVQKMIAHLKVQVAQLNMPTTGITE
jgi:hypothetical protein